MNILEETIERNKIAVETLRSSADAAQKIRLYDIALRIIERTSFRANFLYSRRLSPRYTIIHYPPEIKYILISLGNDKTLDLEHNRFVETGELKIFLSPRLPTDQEKETDFGSYVFSSVNVCSLKVNINLEVLRDKSFMLSANWLTSIINYWKNIEPEYYEYKAREENEKHAFEIYLLEVWRNLEGTDYKGTYPLSGASKSRKPGENNA